MDTTPADNVCLSGGAIGSDRAWGAAAEENGHRVVHYTFQGDGGYTGRNAYVLSDEQLKQMDPLMKAVNARIKRRFPPKSVKTASLLRRNGWQVQNSTALYAVAKIDGRSVKGGTAWAVEAFKILNPGTQSLYLFDEVSSAWHKWTLTGWERMTEPPPRPNGRWTGIGTRHPSDGALRAIQEVFS